MYFFLISSKYLLISSIRVLCVSVVLCTRSSSPEPKVSLHSSHLFAS